MLTPAESLEPFFPPSIGCECSLTFAEATKISDPQPALMHHACTVMVQQGLDVPSQPQWLSGSKVVSAGYASLPTPRSDVLVHALGRAASAALVVQDDITSDT